MSGNLPCDPVLRDLPSEPALHDIPSDPVPDARSLTVMQTTLRFSDRDHVGETFTAGDFE